jgi:hypothetical protein
MEDVKIGSPIDFWEKSSQRSTVSIQLEKIEKFMGKGCWAV